MHVNNFEQTCNYLKEKNFALSYGGIINWGASKSVYITDINGYEIELSEMNGGALSLK